MLNKVHFWFKVLRYMLTGVADISVNDISTKHEHTYDNTV